MKKVFWIFIVGCIACSSRTKLVEVKNDDGQLIERYLQNKETKEREGKSESFDSQGRLLEVAFYKNGELNGERKLYHENGEVQAIEPYKDGQFEGIYQAFYENGQLELEGNYEQSQMTGQWKRYYPTGELMEIVTFVESEENGPFIEYYKNGQLKAKGTYLDGDNEHGELQLFDENGELAKKMDCQKGVCKTVWTSEQKI
ncbi:MAG: toxin-antitoxin system YwqK family antitoxin [Bacteroidota bacterium]